MAAKWGLAMSLVLFIVVNFVQLVTQFLRNTTDLQSKQNRSACLLRRYPLHRYYKMNSMNQPSFLTDETARYVYGEWPVLFGASYTTPASLKICVDQSMWLDSKATNEQPFADGTNPSILSVHRLEKTFGKRELSQLLGPFASSTHFLATACMTNSQCSWNDSPQQVVEYKLSQQSEPTVVLTVLLLLDSDFVRIAQTTVLLIRDAPWGKLRKQILPGAESIHYTPALDDARLFVHDHQVWISYREGKRFGYDAQVLNPVHWQVVQNKLSAVIRASETTSFCCGRNMALMENPLDASALQSLTWVDPVTVTTVDTTPWNKIATTTRRLESISNNKNNVLPNIDRNASSIRHTVKSHVHGTNAFMIYVADTHEFLGVGHFHRPPNRNKNVYARFGHHYTHVFFTISAMPPHALTALSPEFLLPAAAASSRANDGEIIQFLSGLELVDDMLVIAYGINDCEAAVTKVTLASVRAFLRETDRTKQVVDYMEPLKRKQ
jgi:hypothetical protein